MTVKRLSVIALAFFIVMIFAAGYAQAPNNASDVSANGTIKEVTSPTSHLFAPKSISSWPGAGFDFNDGTRQEWVVSGPFTETGWWLCIPILSFHWVDGYNYPNSLGSDPIGDMNGSLQICTRGGDDVPDADYDWWVMHFISPNLEESTVWQAADGYSVKIQNTFVDERDIPGDTLRIYVNLHVTLYDHDEARDRFFVMGAAQPTVNAYVDPGWINIAFDWSSGFTGVPNYDIKQVSVSIWGAPEVRLSGGLNLDEVQPIGDFASVLGNFRMFLRHMWLVTHGAFVQQTFSIDNYGQYPLIYQAKSAPSEASSASTRNNLFDQLNNSDKDVMITGWGDLATTPALGDMMDHIETLGYSADTSQTFPASLDGYEILILVGGGSAHEDIPENVVDDFVNAGNGLIIFERVVDSGDFDSSALSNPVLSIASGTLYSSGCTVVEPTHPLCQGISTNCTFEGYHVQAAMKTLPEVVMRWNDQQVFAATYHLGTGKVVYINDLQAWYSNLGYWYGDQTNGMKLMENALDYVRPVDYHGIAWLSFDPMAGQVAPGQSEEITMTVSGNALPGTYSADVVIICNDLTQSITRIPFSMRVTTSTTPVLSVDPASLNFGNAAAALSFDIENAGGGNLEWSIESVEDKPWLIGILQKSGVNYATIVVAVDRDYLGWTSDTEILTISSNGGNQDVTIQIGKQEGNLPLDWGYAAYTGYSASIILPDSINPVINGTPLTNDYYIGAFSSAGQCFGWSQWQDTTMTMVVWGDDPQTGGVEGFQSGESIIYRVYSLSQQTYWTDVTVAYLVGSGTFENGAYNVFSQFAVSGTEVNEQPDHSNLDFILEQNYPNPFNPETTFRFALKKRSHVKLKIYNIAGELVEVILDEIRDPGKHELHWHVRDLAAGIYMCRMETEGFIKTRKLVLQK